MRDDARRPGLTGTTVGIAVAGLLVGPLLLLLPRAFADVWRAPSVVPTAWGLRGVRTAFASGAEVPAAVTNSLLVGLGTALVALALAWPAARALVRLPVPRRAPWFVVLVAPLLVPSFATGTGLVPWLLRLGLADHLVGVGAAHLLYVLPYVVLALLPAMGSRLDGLEEAARAAGASRWQAARLVVLPAARPTITVGLLLGFLVSWGQVGTSLAVGGGLPMLPVVALPFLRSDPQVAAVLDLLLLVPPVVALLVVARVGRSGSSVGR